MMMHRKFKNRYESQQPNRIYLHNTEMGTPIIKETDCPKKHTPQTCRRDCPLHNKVYITLFYFILLKSLSIRNERFNIFTSEIL